SYQRLSTALASAAVVMRGTVATPHAPWLRPGSAVGEEVEGRAVRSGDDRVERPTGRHLHVHARRARTVADVDGARGDEHQPEGVVTAERVGRARGEPHPGRGEVGLGDRVCDPHAGY